MDYRKTVAATYQRIATYIRHTPLVPSNYYSYLTHNNIYFKCENLQYTSSFKVRGAFSKITSLDNQAPTLITSSGGNHGMAVAYAGKKLNLPVTVVVPEFVPAYRIKMIEDLGAKVIIHGKTMDDLNAKVAEFLTESSYVYIHPFDDDTVIAGQATVAYEVLNAIPDIDVIITSIGGGGLISGIAQYAKAFNPKIKVYGVQTIGADAMSQSLTADKIVALPSITSIATSLGVTKVPERTFSIVKKYIDEVVTVTDKEAMQELKVLLEREKLLVEPATSCTLAAIMQKKLPSLKGKKIAVILCGGNFSLDQLKSYL